MSVCSAATLRGGPGFDEVVEDDEVEEGDEEVDEAVVEAFVDPGGDDDDDVDDDDDDDDGDSTSGIRTFLRTLLTAINSNGCGSNESYLVWRNAVSEVSAARSCFFFFFFSVRVDVQSFDAVDNATSIALISSSVLFMLCSTNGINDPTNPG